MVMVVLDVLLELVVGVPKTVFVVEVDIDVVDEVVPTIDCVVE